jgi:DsbC/DsbD-like thiol-disulfide interchange protein
VIRAFGILNENAPRDSFVYGVPNPGTYVLDAAGAVTAKYFEDDYTERVTASDILVRQFSAIPSAGPGVEETKHLRLTAASSANAARGGQKIALILNIELKPGMHVYAPGVRGYKPVDWEMLTAAAKPEGEAQTAGGPGQVRLPGRLFTEVTWPAPRMLHLKAIGETVPVYEKKLRLVREVTIPSDKLLREVTSPSGVLTLEGVFRYQACDAKTCYNPVSLPLVFSIQILKHDTERVPVELRRQANQR